MSAWQEGFDAYKQGKSSDENPYEDSAAGSIYSDYQQWEEGWYEARAQGAAKQE
jgi:ribosome modulation factor